MLTSIIELPQVDPSPAYPAMYKHAETGMLVLATDSSCGVIIGRSTNQRTSETDDALGLRMGTYHTGWAPFDDPATFWRRVPVGTAVTITQE